MPAAFDFTKEYKDLYLPGTTPALCEVPAILFILVDGTGAPEDAAYQNAVGVLYALAYSIKMSRMGSLAIDGYFDYKMPPLESLWDGYTFDAGNSRHTWHWTAMLRQPPFVTDEVFRWALGQAAAKKPELDVSAARLETWEEGLCVQTLHKGPYAQEPETLAKMDAYIRENSLENDIGPARRHHEIYLSNPQRAKPENLKTVLRCPVRRV
ncbi:GyrI-like domain-containing protein [Ruminococcaceae bacterium OttesenSCG-928-O06]|nr:GyrI-like domain-containing protein [Ruminococcaceae bacterium OttesenSCG-928-O06]